MSSSADRHETGDDGAPPARLRRLPSRLLVHTALHADRLVNERLAAADAHKWHYAVLVALETGPASQATLSRRTGIHRSDMVAVINELADRGHVRRTPDPADRRRNIITMTTQGRRHLRRLDELVAAIEDDLFAPLSPSDRHELSRILTRLLDHYEDQHTRPSGADPTWKAR